jgi:nucleoside-diphosphate-sugar epimerase
MYGAGQSKKSLIPQLEKAIENGDEVFNMSRGDQLRDYLPVEKVAEIIVKCALQDSVQGILNCSSNRPISVLDLVKKHLKKKHKNIKLNTGYYSYPDYEPFHFWGDNTKLLNLIK